MSAKPGPVERWVGRLVNEGKETMMAKTRFREDDGLIHLWGSGLCSFETACGYCDTLAAYQDSTEPPTCAGCIDVAREIFSAITRQELSACLKTPNV